MSDVCVNPAPNMMASRSHVTAAESLIVSSVPLETAASPCFQRDVLIRLSNAAVDLLHRHQKCRQAIDTLKDALAVMKHPSHDESNATTASATQAWARAAARLSQAENEPAAPNEAQSCSDHEQTDSAVTQAHLPMSNAMGVLVLSSRFDPEQAYHLLALRRTSKVCLIMDPCDPALDLALVRSILVYNYGIAHRCCSIASGSVQPLELPATASGTEKCHKLETFCLQIFQYAETLLPPNDAAISHLLFRLILTRNLMMLSCRLGLSLCEHYKETLDPIVSDILGPLVHLDNKGNNDDPPGASAA